MIGPKQIVGEVAVLHALKDRVSAAERNAKDAALDALDEGDRIGAHLPNGASVGTVTVVHGRRTATVTDVDAFTAWVAANHPTEVVTATTVRPGYRAKILTAAAAAGVAVDTTGEAIPGVVVDRGEPYVQVKQTDDQVAAVASAWVRQEITVPSLLELTSGGES